MHKHAIFDKIRSIYSIIFFFISSRGGKEDGPVEWEEQYKTKYRIKLLLYCCTAVCLYLLYCTYEYEFVN